MYSTMLFYLLTVVLVPIVEPTSSTRYLDPVVLTGADVPSFLGCVECVDQLVAFSWTEGAWSQVPVQVDERHLQDFYYIKNKPCKLCQRNMTTLVYADPSTFSGKDEDDALDEDDEIVFMARFLGEKNEKLIFPEGAVENTMEEVEVIDPITDSTLGFMYLFLSDGSLKQDAGNPLIKYTFNLTTVTENGSNDYFDVYDFGENNDASNPENTHFESQSYQRHFAENWNSDDVKIWAGDSTGESLMAHQDFQFLKDSCGRCVFSFMWGATAFIVNKEGPVRALRSWVGANSGTITQRDSIMYEQREDVTTHLRVHSIPGIMDYVTYAEDLPLVFYNCNNEEGIMVDGVHKGDSFNKKYCPWEFVTGRAGSVFRTYQVDSDLGDHFGISNDALAEHALESWFYDNRVPSEIIEDGLAVHPNNFHQCSTKLTMQKAAWGTHGIKTKDHIPHLPNTDPNIAKPKGSPCDGCSAAGGTETLNNLDITNNYYYLPPGLEVETAKQIYQAATKPLTIKK